MDDNTALVLVAGVNVIGIFITAYFGYKASTHAKAAVIQAENSIAVSQKNAEKLEGIKENIAIIDKGMNGMKEELVKATAAASKAEGKIEGKEEAKADADHIAEVVAAAVTEVVSKKE